VIPRRTVLAGLAALGSAPVAAATGARVVALEWAFASTLVALGRPPAGVGEPDLYRTWVVEPALPAGVVDVGLRVQPSLERVAALKPDLVLIGPLSEPARPVLEPIAPVVRYDAFTPVRRPLDATIAYTRDLGRRLGDGAAAEALIARTEAAFEAARAALGPSGRRILLVSLLDERHVNVYGRGSLFGDVVERLGLANAWDRPTTVWGTTAAGVEALARHPEADLAVLLPLPPGLDGTLDRPGLWRSLAALRRGRTVTLPAAWMFGDLAACARFAGLVAAALGSSPGLPGR
jgi:ferric hydroxamate transport system substrate-binding protein